MSRKLIDSRISAWIICGSRCNSLARLRGLLPSGSYLARVPTAMPSMDARDVTGDWTRTNLKFYRRHYLPRDSIFILAGDVTLAQGKEFAAQLFGAWKNEEPPPNETDRSAVADWKPQERRRRYARSRPGRGHGGKAGDQAQLARILLRAGGKCRVGQWLCLAPQSRDPDQTRAQLRRWQLARSAAPDPVLSAPLFKPKTNRRPRSRAW